MISIDRLHQALRARADEATKKHLRPLQALRVALDAYEEAALLAWEARLSAPLARQLGLDDLDTSGLERALLDERSSLQQALRVALTWATERMEQDARAASPPRRLGMTPVLSDVEPTLLDQEPEEPPASSRETLSSREEAAAPPEEEAPPRQPPALAHASMEEVSTSFEPPRSAWTTSGGAQVPTNAAERRVLQGLLQLVGEVPTLSTDLDLIDEVDRIEAVASDERLASWDMLGDRVAQAWVSMLVARLRAVRERLSPDLKSLLARHRALITRMPTYWIGRKSPLFINGMKKDHMSKARSWGEDARYAYAELLARGGLS